MRIAHLLLVIALLGAVTVQGQDSKPDEFALYSNVKNVVGRFTQTNSVVVYLGIDIKTLRRSGDLVALAIIRTIPEDELTSPTKLRAILGLVSEAFFCPSRCIESPGNQQPKVTMLLLEHLHNHTTGQSQADIDKARDSILEQIRGAN